MPKNHNLTIKTEIKPIASVKATGFKAGLSRTKGWFQWIFVGEIPQRGRAGALALVQVVAKRVEFGNWYSKKVMMKDSGEVIHTCEEPLDQHQGHGSDKRPKRAPQSN